MATETIKKGIEATLASMRDLAYEAHTEWEKQGMAQDDLLSLSNKANELITDFSQTLARFNMNFSGTLKIRMLPGRGEKKIQAIKAVRELTGMGLKEAKDMVDKTAGGGWVDLEFATGYDSPDDSKVKNFAADMTNAGFEAK